MRLQICFLGFLLVLMGCTDKPYPTKWEDSLAKQQTVEAKKIQVISKESIIAKASKENLGEAEFLPAKTASLNKNKEGTSEEKLHVSFRKLNEENNHGQQLVDLNKDNIAQNWQEHLREDLEDGKYVVTISKASNEESPATDMEKIITIDTTPPRILGQKEGVEQKNYIQESKEYRQYKDGKIEPQGYHMPLWFFPPPIIHRWITNVDNDITAPLYRFEVKEKNALKQVRYGISKECQSYHEVQNILEPTDGIYEAKIIQRNASVNLEVSSPLESPYCLSIWAEDEAGNKANYDVEFFWQVTAPPLLVEVNSSKYDFENSPNDFRSNMTGPDDLFEWSRKSYLKPDLYIAHAIISNPHDSRVEIKLDLSGDFKLVSAFIKENIPHDSIEIDYFQYDAKRNKVLHKKSAMDGMIYMRAKEVILARFKLTQPVLINNPYFYKNRFGAPKSFAVFFNPLRKETFDKEIPYIEGLVLKVALPGKRVKAESFLVPWGYDHQSPYKVVNEPRKLIPTNH